MAQDSSRTRNKAIFVASFLAHGALATGLHAHASERHTKTLTKQIDIELAPPPPPPPPPPEEEPPPPPPEPQKEQPKPKPLAPRPQPVKQVAVQKDPPPENLGSSLPVSDEGTLPPAEPGVGIPGPEPAQAPPPAPLPPPPPPILEPKEGANYKNNPRPPYPRLALREGWQGKVILRVKVTPQGKVAGAAVQKSSGRSVLDDAALEIVRTWTFVPATQGGQPVAGTVSVPFEFHLN